MTKRGFLLLASALAACKTPVPSHAPFEHRAVAESCASDRPPGGCVTPGSCTKDSECSDGENGRCTGARNGCACSYDACSDDSQCATDSLCACRGGVGRNAVVNSCVPTDCHTDADCGVGGEGYCSPSYDPLCGSYLGVVLWHCHTAQDQCIDDRDCGALDGGTAGYGAPFCGYAPEVGYWRCTTTMCAG